MKRHVECWVSYLPCRLSFQEVQGAQASQEGQGSHEVPGKQTEKSPKLQCPQYSMLTSQTGRWGINTCLNLMCGWFRAAPSVWLPLVTQKRGQQPPTFHPTSEFPLHNSTTVDSFSQGPVGRCRLCYVNRSYTRSKSRHSSTVLFHSKKRQMPNAALQASLDFQMHSNHAD